MTLIVEDGSIVANANSYISITNFTTYATARTYTLVGSAEPLLIQAMDYLENLMFKGTKRTSTQALQWPRFDVYIDKYYFSSTSIPQQLIDAQCEIAIAIDMGNGPLTDIDVQTKREKVGPIEVEYASNAAPFVINRRINNKLRKLLEAGAMGGNVIGVGRG